MFIASKLVEPVAIAGTSLVKYTDNTYQLSELLVSLNYTDKLEYLLNDPRKILIIFYNILMEDRGASPQRPFVLLLANFKTFNLLGFARWWG